MSIEFSDSELVYMHALGLPAPQGLERRTMAAVEELRRREAKAAPRPSGCRCPRCRAIRPAPKVVKESRT